MHEDVRSVYYDLIVPVNTSFSVVNLLVLPQLSDSCVPRLEDFLTHQYPTVRFLLLCSHICGLMLSQLPQIRVETARFLYLFLQSRDIGKDTDDVEELLLETEWFVDERSHSAES